MCTIVLNTRNLPHFTTTPTQLISLHNNTTTFLHNTTQPPSLTLPAHTPQILIRDSPLPKPTPTIVISTSTCQSIAFNNIINTHHPPNIINTHHPSTLPCLFYSSTPPPLRYPLLFVLVPSSFPPLSSNPIIPTITLISKIGATTLSTSVLIPNTTG